MLPPECFPPSRPLSRPANPRTDHTSILSRSDRTNLFHCCLVGCTVVAAAANPAVDRGIRNRPEGARRTHHSHLEADYYNLLEGDCCSLLDRRRFEGDYCCSCLEGGCYCSCLDRGGYCSRHLGDNKHLVASRSQKVGPEVVEGRRVGRKLRAGVALPTWDVSKSLPGGLLWC